MADLPLTPTPPPSDKHTFNSALGFTIASAVCMAIAGIGTLIRVVDGQNGFAGLMMFAVLLGPIFLIISLFYNIALIFKATSSGRKLYAILASIITGLLSLAAAVAFIIVQLR